MSVQPNLDLGEVRQNKVKLAMAVGNNRHYTINSIAPRHFIQTGEAAGLPANITQDILEELLTHVPQAIERAWQGLPSKFTGVIAKSIKKGMLNRLDKIKYAKTKGWKY
jgi:serine/threonine-protein kinase HipA